ncbi:hypothetical protein EDB86DRAFT_256699 [Lactarius hatsudake]|nr:hypothetical protein EDB86DRAFT_256699 [Lactarius hatsudake]
MLDLNFFCKFLVPALPSHPRTSGSSSDVLRRLDDRPQRPLDPCPCPIPTAAQIRRRSCSQTTCPWCLPLPLPLPRRLRPSRARIARRRIHEPVSSRRLRAFPGQRLPPPPSTDGSIVPLPAYSPEPVSVLHPHHRKRSQHASRSIFRRCDSGKEGQISGLG